jgi:hypothetical protein
METAHCSRLHDLHGPRAMLGIRAPNAGPCAIKAQGLKAQRAGLKAQRFPEGLGGGDLKAASTQQANKANPSEIPVP